MYFDCRTEMALLGNSHLLSDYLSNSQKFLKKSTHIWHLHWPFAIQKLPLIKKSSHF
jgi:hypothetical protein